MKSRCEALKSESRFLTCALVFLLTPAVALATVVTKPHSASKTKSHSRKYLPRLAKVRRRIPLHRASSSHRTLASSKSSRTTRARRSHHAYRSSRARAASHRWHMPATEIPASRAGQIQQALIQAGDLHGQPTGQWDAQTREAMKLYQQQNGFQATGLPDAKSLMKMGLGPHPLPAQADPLAKSQLPLPSQPTQQMQQANAGLGAPGGDANAPSANHQPYPQP
ncbi:MAG TPA: peptidoglycan-binding domain-containing protein [Terriglobia bacterium]|nr:peptidoglycan-binding domain-containing protein [Terriglobia bacterium]